MAKRRKVGNLLALAVLSLAAERPMHPYEMASLLRERGKQQSIKINWGSLYTVVGNLEKHRLIEATETVRAGRRPERTVYSITDAGREELRDWLRELLGTPEKEYRRFEAALSLLVGLPPGEVTELLTQRLRTLDAQLAEGTQALQHWGKELPRLFLIEAEYDLAMLRAEADWVRGLLAEMQDGSLAGLAGWRTFYETGQLPPEMRELSERGAEPD
jgi:DNA-binding PadR family transcriptional regulator